MQKYDVVICGAGISGLSTGVSLIKKGLDPRKLLILESSGRCGGNVESKKVDDNLVEIGPNSLMLKSQKVLSFLRDLNMFTEIVTPKAGSKKRFLRRGNEIWQITPRSILAKLNSSSKLRLGALTFSSAAPCGETESVYDFFCRKIGRKLTSELVIPFVSGIYAGDCKSLLVKQAFPNLFKLESRYNSIPLGLILEGLGSDRVEKPYRGLISFRGGLQSLTNRMADLLVDSIRTNNAVKEIKAVRGHGFEISSENETIFAQKLVISLPAHIACKILRGTNFESLKRHLNLLIYPSLRVFHFSSLKSQAKVKDRGFGFLSQQYEPSKILGCLWPASCFEDRCSIEQEIHTVFSGGQLYPDLYSYKANFHAELVHKELKEVLKMDGNMRLLHNSQWSHAIPQYDIRQAALQKHLNSNTYDKLGLYFSCNYVGGVSLGDCILHGLKTANEITGVQ
ncbi:MAG: protoporphyrinogen oxidase [bacterium]|nr:protoporphyrinogen oxidase [bacterium]